MDFKNKAFKIHRKMRLILETLNSVFLFLLGLDFECGRVSSLPSTPPLVFIPVLYALPIGPSSLLGKGIVFLFPKYFFLAPWKGQDGELRPVAADQPVRSLLWETK